MCLLDALAAVRICEQRSFPLSRKAAFSSNAQREDKTLFRKKLDIVFAVPLKYGQIASEGREDHDYNLFDCTDLSLSLPVPGDANGRSPSIGFLAKESRRRQSAAYSTADAASMRLVERTLILINAAPDSRIGQPGRELSPAFLRPFFGHAGAWESRRCRKTHPNPIFRRLPCIKKRKNR